ncbi:hypothetical protein AKO1_005998 [Acrasis kona]|uniref:Uncharacterized protein n=1 Tax=Acrasis kona TaxID=1008807 RepID=A0AAW2YLA7_9EUKA
MNGDAVNSSPRDDSIQHLSDTQQPTQEEEMIQAITASKRIVRKRTAPTLNEPTSQAKEASSIESPTMLNDLITQSTQLVPEQLQAHTNTLPTNNEIVHHGNQQESLVLDANSITQESNHNQSHPMTDQHVSNMVEHAPNTHHDVMQQPEDPFVQPHHKDEESMVISPAIDCTIIDHTTIHDDRPLSTSHAVIVHDSQDEIDTCAPRHDDLIIDTHHVIESIREQAITMNTPIHLSTSDNHDNEKNPCSDVIDHIDRGEQSSVEKVHHDEHDPSTLESAAHSPIINQQQLITNQSSILQSLIRSRYCGNQIAQSLSNIHLVQSITRGHLCRKQGRIHCLLSELHHALELFQSSPSHDALINHVIPILDDVMSVDMNHCDGYAYHPIEYVIEWFKSDCELMNSIDSLACRHVHHHSESCCGVSFLQWNQIKFRFFVLKCLERGELLMRFEELLNGGVEGDVYYGQNCALFVSHALRNKLLDCLRILIGVKLVLSDRVYLMPA